MIVGRGRADNSAARSNPKLAGEVSSSPGLLGSTPVNAPVPREAAASFLCLPLSARIEHWLASAPTLARAGLHPQSYLEQ